MCYYIDKISVCIKMSSSSDLHTINAGLPTSLVLPIQGEHMQQPAMQPGNELQTQFESSPLGKHSIKSSKVLSDLIPSLPIGQLVRRVFTQRDPTDQFNMHQYMLNAIDSKLTSFEPVQPAMQPAMQPATQPAIPPTPRITRRTTAFGDIASSMATVQLEENVPLCETWNGAAQYAQVGEDIISGILGMCNKFVNEPYVAPKGKGTKRKGQPKAESNPAEKLSPCQKQQMDTQMKDLIGRIKSLPEMERAIHIDLLWRMVFFERAISNSSRVGEGKGNKTISEYLFTIMSREFPETAKKLACLLPQYGCFKDVNYLIQFYVETKFENSDAMIDSLVRVYSEAIDKDLRSILGKGIFEQNGIAFTHAELSTAIDALHKEVKTMKPEQVKARFKEHVSNAGKWFPRSASRYGNYKKRNETRAEHNKEALPEERERLFSSQIPLLMHGLYFPGKPLDWSDSSKVNFYESITRKTMTTLNRIIDTVEVHMSANEWDMINPKTVPGAAFFQHRLGFLNQTVGEDLPSHMEETGDRTTNPARIALRKRCKEAAEKGEISFTGDSIKFAAECRKYTQLNIGAGHSSRSTVDLSATVRLTLQSQFEALKESIKSILLSEYKEKVEAWEADGSKPDDIPLNPFHCIATIDVSGSMGERMYEAIVLGMIITDLSELTTCALTFDTKPQLIDLKGCTDFADKFIKIAHAAWGGSTNIQAANELLLTIMKNVKKADPTFRGRIVHIILSDMQFNPRNCEVSGDWEPFAATMKRRFTLEGFDLPLTTFWNLNGRTQGVPCQGTDTGMIMCEGLSQGLLVRALGGGLKYVVDPKTGETVAAINPVSAFLKSLARPDYFPVSEVVYRTGEGVFANLSNVARCMLFHSENL
jgi:hypothetical protein